MPTLSVPATVAGPARPRPPKTLEFASADEDDLRDAATYRALGFYDLALPGRTAKGAEFVQCRFNRADLGGTTLAGAILTDCLIEDTSLAYVRAERSILHRVAIRSSCLTGLQWLDGTLQDVTVRGCRAPGSVFREAQLHAVLFTDTDLSGADFGDADLSGAEFVRCDLTGARFDRAEAGGVRFEDCILDATAALSGLAGATIATTDPAGLAHFLAGVAGALGITVEVL